MLYFWTPNGHLKDTNMRLDEYTVTKHKGIKSNKDCTEVLLDFRQDSKRYRKKISYSSTQGTKADRLKLAYKALEDYRQELAKLDDLGEARYDTIEDYFNRTQTKRSKAVKNALQSLYKRFIQEQIGSKLPREVKPRNITLIMDSVAHFSKSQQKKLLEILVPIFKMCLDDETVDRSPIKESHRVVRSAVQEKKIVQDAVTKYKAVHAQIMTTFADKPKIRALILFCFHGRRRNEAMGIKWSDIDLNNRRYVIRGENSKVKTSMEFFLPDDVASALMELERVSNYVFYSEKDIDKHVTDIQHHVHQLRDDVGIPELTLHWMRNLAVSALSTMGVDSLALSSMLGHTDPATLRKYLTMQRASDTENIANISQVALTPRLIEE